jgi:hypothetical protein
MCSSRIVVVSNLKRFGAILQASFATSGPAGWCIAACFASDIQGCWFTKGSRQFAWLSVA